ncbi:MAG TPA: class I SAM-dependent methyltransferase [Trebonia sp.]|nr:class I SAM-dependent methyltransferase [Trebonia sp.]
MEEQERLRRGSSFGAVAQAYAEYRPDYPEEAVRWALEPAVGSAGGPASTAVSGLRVLDLGAGTGKLTAVLIALGAAVTAVEPDEAMLAELRRRYCDIPALHGSAEAIPLPDASVDAVLCGQAMHWFDMDRAVPEIARVLVPGGPLAGMWNADDDRVEWVDQMQSVAGGLASPSLARRRAEAAHFGVYQFGTTFFGPVERGEFAHGWPYTAESLVALIGTHSQVLIMPEEERSARLSGIRSFLADRPETTSGEFTLPMVTAVVRSVRL